MSIFKKKTKEHGAQVFQQSHRQAYWECPIHGDVGREVLSAQYLDNVPIVLCWMCISEHLKSVGVSEPKKITINNQGKADARDERRQREKQ